MHSIWFTDSIRGHPYLVHWPSLVRLSVPKNLHLLHVCQRGSLPILVLVVLQKNVHQDTEEDGKNQLNAKGRTISIVIDRSLWICSTQLIYYLILFLSNFKRYYCYFYLLFKL